MFSDVYSAEIGKYGRAKNWGRQKGITYYETYI